MVTVDLFDRDHLKKLLGRNSSFIPMIFWYTYRCALTCSSKAGRGKAASEKCSHWLSIQDASGAPEKYAGRTGKSPGRPVPGLL